MKSQKKPRISVVIGGGGLKPFAALPLLWYLRENHIAVDRIIAASGGSMIGAFFAMSMSSEQEQEVLKRVKRKQPFYYPQLLNLLGMIKVPYTEFEHSKGMFAAKPLLKVFEEVYGNSRIEDLPIPLSIITTELESGKAVYIEEGLVKEAVYASSTIYPFMEAIRIHDEYLVDGCFCTSIPVKKALENDPDLLIITHFEFSPDPKPLTFFHYTTNFYNMAVERKSQELMENDLEGFRGETAIFRIHFDKPVPIYSTWEIPGIIEFGQQNFEKQKSWLEKKLANVSP